MKSSDSKSASTTKLKPSPPIYDNVCGVECRCPKILDPYPTNTNRTTAIPHYCKVCNIQLNSCRQAEIHANGKKHDKRLQYLHFCMETIEKSKNEKLEEETQISSAYHVAPVQPQSLPTVSYITLPNPTYSFSAQQTQQQLCTSSCFYHPCSHYVPPPLPATQGYFECGPPVPQLAPTLPPPPVFHIPPPSINIVSSKVQDKQYSSNCKKNDQKKRNRSNPKAYCEICCMSFPTKCILDNHKLGSRHLRKVKSQEVFRQLQDSGAEFSQDDVATEMRCEMCQVSVNSSHQLQAHLTGHKHRGRVSKQDRKKVDSQSNSTLNSVSMSEHNVSGKNRKFSRRSSEDYHSYPHHKGSYLKPAYHRSSDQIPASPRTRLSRLNKNHSKSMTIPSSLQRADCSNLNKFSRSSSNFSAYSDSDSSVYNESVRFESYHRTRSISARQVATSSTSSSSSNEDEYYDPHTSYRARLKSSSSLKNVYSKKYHAQNDEMLFHTSQSVQKSPGRNNGGSSSGIIDFAQKITSKSTTELTTTTTTFSAKSSSKGKSSSISEIPMLNVFFNRLNDPRVW